MSTASRLGLVAGVVAAAAAVGGIAAVLLVRPRSQPGQEPAWAPTDPQPLPDVLIDPAVVVEKGARRLTVYSDGAPVKGYRVVLGSAPMFHKLREGDGRTPEGEYYVCSRNPDSRHHRSMGLSYPNTEDADAALQSGLISRREYRAIEDAIRHLRRPPWKTPLGGEIMIHGGGTAAGDWTEGCIALDDTDAAELHVALPLGTPVTIVP